jgi:uncharacterized membrane protein HdeD (DUF308 family)
MQHLDRMETSAASTVTETKLWLAVLSRGFVALLFALLALAGATPAIADLARLFAVYALVDGALALYAARRAQKTHAIRHGRVLALEGILDVAVAVAAFAIPGLVALRIIAALRFVTIGASELVWTRHERATELVELSAVASFFVSLLILAWPGTGDVALPWLLGLAALVTGGLDFAGAMSELRTRVLLERTV